MKGEEMSIRRPLRRTATLIAGAAITSTLLAHVAAAVPPRDEHSTAGPASAVTFATLGRFTAAGGAIGQAPSPDVVAPKVADLSSTVHESGRRNRCIGRTDNPHNSRHFPGDVSVSSRTICPPYAVTVIVRLYKRVHGSLRLLDTASNSGVGRTQANAHGPCGRRGTTHRFVAKAYHTATDHEPTPTRNARTVTCR
jgi:hypothetical protein